MLEYFYVDDACYLLCCMAVPRLATPNGEPVQSLFLFINKTNAGTNEPSASHWFQAILHLLHSGTHTGH